MKGDGIMPKLCSKMKDFYKKHKEEILYGFNRMIVMDTIEKQDIYSEIFGHYENKRKNEQHTSLEIEEALDYVSK